jgi:beta-lactamase family protein
VAGDGSARGNRTAQSRSVVEFVKARGLLFEPGTQELYSSAGYTALARVVEVVEGKPFDDVLASKEQLGNPTDTTWSSWYGRTDGYESSVDYLPSQDLTFVFLSNVRSTTNWQLRTQAQNILRERAVTSFLSVPAVAALSESPESIVGPYDDAPDSIFISHAGGRLFRDGDDIYPIAGGWYYEPASGMRMRFTRDRRRLTPPAIPQANHTKFEGGLACHPGCPSPC